ncbi:histidine phosphatase family protein [Pseudonocardia kujensis]|uniref:histidine phosphatase family protein n=1 Tax=Pseudonocardia kujensis TaxID=1128675 RepID=UPI001E4A32DD|nr:histidine phosphatase family protein [Pseudonocardia kujensis]MCE0761952.1 histidine phosphatase family protein [Pseudonocardia kujensis]
MELLLVRHARPLVVAGDGVTIADPPLTAEGRAQAAVLAKSLAAGQYGEVGAVVTSTMRRARETAAPLTEALGLVAEVDERLVELDHGWTTYGQGLEAYPTRRAAYREMSAGRWCGNTYDPAAFRARVRAGMEAVIERHPESVVAVVCHGAVISAYLAELLGLEQTVFLAPDYCSVTRILAGPGEDREVLSVNEALHMRLS